MITSMIPGRVRVRNHALKCETQLSKLLQEVEKAFPCVSCVGNATTGSLLLVYDRANKIEEELTKFFADKHVESSPKKNCCKSPFALLGRNPEMVILNTTFLATVASAFCSKRVHVGVGLAFAGLTAYHIFKRRKAL